MEVRKEVKLQEHGQTAATTITTTQSFRGQSKLDKIRERKEFLKYEKERKFENYVCAV